MKTNNLEKFKFWNDVIAGNKSVNKNLCDYCGNDDSKVSVANKKNLNCDFCSDCD